MQAIRTIVKPNGRRQITVDLPADFSADSVEVIVLPYQEIATSPADVSATLTAEQQILLSFPVATDEDIQFITEKRQHLDQWQ